MEHAEQLDIKKHESAEKQLAKLMDKLKQACEPAEYNLISAFIEYQRAKESQLRTLCGYAQRLLAMKKNKIVPFNYTDLKLDDDRYLAVYNNINKLSSFTIRTRRDYKLCINSFYRWLFKTEALPKSIFGIEIKSEAPKVKREELFEPADIDRLIVSTGQDKQAAAAILILWEAGCRSGEFLKMVVGDLDLEPADLPPRYFRLHVPQDKTNERTLTIGANKKIIQDYLAVHVMRKNGKLSAKAPLWCFKYGGRIHKMNHGRLQYIVNQVAKAANLPNKKLKYNLHNFRKSAESYKMNKQGFSFAECQRWFGQKNIEVLNAYCKAGDQDLEIKVLRQFGDSRDDVGQVFRKVCWCGQEAGMGQAVCTRCGAPLTAGSSSAIDDRMAALEKKLEQLLGSNLASEQKVLNFGEGAGNEKRKVDAKLLHKAVKPNRT